MIPQNQQSMGQANQQNLALLDESELDRQYQEYKTQFSLWREQNKNHPDRKAFEEYEQQWKRWEAQVEQRRSLIRQMKQVHSNASQVVPQHSTAAAVTVPQPAVTVSVAPTQPQDSSTDFMKEFQNMAAMMGMGGGTGANTDYMSMMNSMMGSMGGMGMNPMMSMMGSMMQPNLFNPMMGMATANMGMNDMMNTMMQTMASMLALMSSGNSAPAGGGMDANSMQTMMNMMSGMAGGGAAPALPTMVPPTAQVVPTATPPQQLTTTVPALQPLVVQKLPTVNLAATVPNVAQPARLPGMPPHGFAVPPPNLTGPPPSTVRPGAPLFGAPPPSLPVAPSQTPVTQPINRQPLMDFENEEAISYPPPSGPPKPLFSFRARPPINENGEDDGGYSPESGDPDTDPHGMGWVRYSRNERKQWDAKALPEKRRERSRSPVAWRRQSALLQEHEVGDDSEAEEGELVDQPDLEEYGEMEKRPMRSLTDFAREQDLLREARRQDVGFRGLPEFVDHPGAMPLGITRCPTGPGRPMYRGDRDFDLDGNYQPSLGRTGSVAPGRATERWI